MGGLTGCVDTVFVVIVELHQELDEVDGVGLQIIPVEFPEEILETFDDFLDLAV